MRDCFLCAGFLIQKDSYFQPLKDQLLFVIRCKLRFNSELELSLIDLGFFHFPPAKNERKSKENVR